jgi:urea ABC transporter urea binding protein
LVQEKSVTLTQSVRVGLIHSLSGTMAISEQPLLEAELMAIDEINKTGGILGRQIEPVTMDGASTPETFAQKAQELLSSGVKFLFGCWTSASRKAVKPIVEDADGLLWYPVQYEGLEESEHIVYTGSCPVQQIVPAVEWVLAHIGSRIFLVGSDYVYPRTANNLIRSRVETIVGERYVPQGGMDFASIIEEIQRQKPDVVFSTVFGESNLAFYRQYHAAGIDAQSIPIMAVCVSETELQPIADLAAGHYVCRNYFQSVNRPENQRFVANYKKRCGEAAVCSAPMATAYAQIYLWKLAVEAAGSFDVAQVRSQVVGCEFLGPAGPIAIESNHHTSMCAYIGRATPHGQFEVLDSTAGIRPWPWLGIEDSKLLYKTAVKEAMAAYPEVQNVLVELAVADKGFRETSRLNSLLLENMLDVVVQTDLVGTCEYASPSFKTVLGYDPKYVLGRSLFELVHPNDLDNALEIVLKALATSSTATFDYRYKHADGHYVWLESVGNPLFDATGQMIGAVLVTRDITERKRIDDELTKFKTISDRAGHGAATSDLEGNFTYVNESFAEMHGYSAEELIGKPLSIFHNEEQMTNVKRLTMQLVEKGSFVGEEVWHKRRDGTVFPTLMTGTLMSDKNGKPLYLSTTAIDITERKQSEEALRESEERFRQAMDATSDGLWDWNVVTDEMYFSPAYYRMLGYEPGELPGLKDTWLNLVHPDDREEALRINQDCIENRIPNFAIEFRMRNKIGGWKWILGRGKASARDANGRALRMIGAHEDITERKKVQDALQDSEQKYHGLVENTPNFVGIIQDGVLKYANKAHERSGWTVEELTSPSFNFLENLVAKEFRDIVRENIARRLRGEEVPPYEFTLQTRDGSEIPVVIIASVITYEGKPADEYILTDITERKKAEASVRESEEKYRVLVENASDSIFMMDGEGRVLSLNKAAARLLRREPEEAVGKSVFDLFPNEIAAGYSRTLKEVFRTGESMTAESMMIAGENEMWISSRINPVRSPEGKVLAVMGVATDITERKKIERMKDQFVSMVSHELRTPLTSIRASLGLLAGGVVGALPEKGQRMLEIAVTNTDRLVRLINDILDSERLVSGKTPMEKKQCSTAQLVKQASDVMKPMAEKAGVSLSVESQDAELWADPDRIVQALTNLISNAIKFSQKGGKIRVTAEHKENQMLFRVQDEGRGIPPDKLGLLFERFQQLDSSDAREKGGSGLGLSISRSIIEQHNGKIWVESKVGKGSTFLFTLPLLEAQVPFQPETTTGAPSTRKVLIIEDDPDLANILAAMLERHNIQSHIALTGGKGIALSRQMHPDLIVLDLILPDIDGSIVVETLRKDNILRSVPLVVYTVRELDKQQRENLRLGETLFFTKSRIPPEQFEEKVVQFMKRVFTNRGETSVS